MEAEKIFFSDPYSNRLTSQMVRRTLILAQTLTSDPYNRGPLKRRLIVHEFYPSIKVAT